VLLRAESPQRICSAKPRSEAHATHHLEFVANGPALFGRGWAMGLGERVIPGRTGREGIHAACFEVERQGLKLEGVARLGFENRSRPGRGHQGFVMQQVTPTGDHYESRRPPPPSRAAPLRGVSEGLCSGVAACGQECLCPHQGRTNRATAAAG